MKRAGARREPASGTGRPAAAPSGGEGRWGAPQAARVAGAAAAFVVAVDLLRAIRPLLLLDPEPSWAPVRLLLGLALVSASAAAGGIVAAAFLLWARSRLARPAGALPFSRGALAGLTAAAILVGAVVRFVALERIPWPLWVDDVSLVGPTLALRGTADDFADAVRPAPAGVAKPYGSVGVLYLQAHRLALRLFGVTVFGVRFLAAAAGVVSLATAALLGRALLPPGGGTLAALVLAGMRWHLILSRWGWVALALTPIVDLAALLLVRARRARSAPLAGAAGMVAGLGAHVYLAAWVACAGLLAYSAWSGDRLSARRDRLRLAALFASGFLAAATPLLLLRQNRSAPYFARTSDHNVLIEMRRARSPLPPLAAAADSLVAPWLLPDPMPLHDLPGRSRLGWILGVPVAVALGHALLAPGREIAGFLLSHGGAALAASVAGGQAGLPNGFRFAYLSTVAAVAAADGILALLRAVPSGRRRAAALCGLGLVAASGAAGARDALMVWGQSRDTFDYFHGPDTLLARAAIRWGRFGPVEADLSRVHSPITFDAVRSHRLDPEARRWEAPRAAGPPSRAFRIAAPGSAPAHGERLLERLTDGWGREWGVVLGRKTRNVRHSEELPGP